MADGSPNPIDSGSPVVLPLRPEGIERRVAKPTAKPARPAAGAWLTNHVRGLVADVDALADELALTPRRRTDQPPVGVPPTAAPPPVHLEPARAAMPSVTTPVGTVRITVHRVTAAVVTPPARSAMVRVRVAAQRIPDPRMRITRTRVAARSHMGWRDRLIRMAVHSTDPELSDTARALDPAVSPGAATATPSPDLVTLPKADAAVAVVEPAVATPPVVTVVPAAELAGPTPAAVLIGAAVTDAAVIAAALKPIIVPAEGAVANPAPTLPAAVPAPIAEPPVRQTPAYGDIIVNPSTVVVVSPARRSRPQWRATADYIFGLITAGLMALSVVVCALICAAVLTGHHPETVVTGSMVPTIPVGSMVVSEKVPVNTLKPGDILVFPRPANAQLANQQDETIVHRIIAVNNNPNGNIEITTKGDANTGKDCWNPPACPVSRDGNALADRVVYILPGFGNAAAWLRLGVIIFVVIVVLSMVIGWGISQIRRELAR